MTKPDADTSSSMYTPLTTAACHCWSDGYGMKTLLMIALLVFPNAAFAGFYDGAALLEYCSPTANRPGDFCSAYVAGVIDTLGNEGWRECVGDRTPKLSQVTGVVAKYLADHPEMLDVPGETLVKAAFREAFCPEK
jgi:hypothetical protein